MRITFAVLPPRIVYGATDRAGYDAASSNDTSGPDSDTVKNYTVCTDPYIVFNYNSAF